MYEKANKPTYSEFKSNDMKIIHREQSYEEKYDRVSRGGRILWKTQVFEVAIDKLNEVCNFKY